MAEGDLRVLKEVSNVFTETEINYSGATEKPTTTGTVVIGFTDADPVVIYTLLDEAVTSLTFTTSGAIVGKCIDWYIKGNYAITFDAAYMKTSGSEAYGGVHAIVQLRCAVNPTDGTTQFWYCIINKSA